MIGARGARQNREQNDMSTLHLLEPPSGFGAASVFVRSASSRSNSSRACAARLAASDYRVDLLRVIGANGAIDALFTTDRNKVAPAFYACAQSMSKFLVQEIGMDQSVALFPAMKRGDWVAMLEQAAGMPLSEVRRRWQIRLGIDSP